MKTYLKNSLIFLLLASTQASAEPTLYPKDLKVLSSVVNRTDSNIMADEADSKTVWVMPPNTARAVVSGLHTKTANMGFCAEMGDLQKYSRDLNEDIYSLQKAANSRRDELVDLQRQATKKNEYAEAYAAERNLKVLVDLDDRIEKAEARLSELYERSNTCEKDCDLISEEIRSVTKDKSEMLKARIEFTKQNTADVREYNKRKKAADAAFDSVKKLREIYSQLSADLEAVRTRFLQAYGSFGKMEGARAGINYISDWNKNVETLRQNNPGFNFQKMATKDSTLMTEIAGLDNVDAQGAILSIGLGGAVKNGVAKFPNYPESLSTNVVLSLIGACPMEFPEYFDLKNTDPKNMRYGITISYDYDSVFTAKASATYNMYKMYQKIVTSKKKNGFFKSRSWSSVEEKNFFRDSFVVTWDDKENVIPNEEKDSREREMRQSVLTRLVSLALPETQRRGDIIAAAPPNKNGAVVISEQLMKSCPGNGYCIAGAAVFTVLDAIFGSSETTSSYTNIQDLEIVEGYERTQKITKSALTSYLNAN